MVGWSDLNDLHWSVEVHQRAQLVVNEISQKLLQIKLAIPI